MFDIKALFENLEDWAFANRNLLVVSLFGILLIGGGLFVFSSGVFEPEKVEILDNQQTLGLSASGQKVVVEVSGAVEKPGVYEVDQGDRVDKVLVLADGLAAGADRDWVSRNLNRAAKVADGQKIFIPSKGSMESRGSTGVNTPNDPYSYPVRACTRSQPSEPKHCQSGKP